MAAGLVATALSLSFAPAPVPTGTHRAVAKVPGVASRNAHVCMLAKRGRKPANPQPEDDDDELIESEELEQRSLRMVDPMTTSLGREEDLKPYPGPPVIDEPVVDEETRPLFALFSRYEPKQTPGERLSTAYVDYLEEAHSNGIAICMPHYMLSAQKFDQFWEMGTVLNDDDIARLDAEEEAQQAAADAAATAAVEAGAEDAVAADFMPGAAPIMEPIDVPFKLGHLTVCRAASHATVAGWASADPVQVAGGYTETRLHEWARLTEPALCMPLGSGESAQPYCVYAIDRSDAGDMRANTRDAHLDWLRESGRVVMAGPLVEPASDAAGKRVGSLLIVNGDDLDEVHDWAAADPYKKAGLFESVTVAPLNEFAIEELAEA